MEDQLDKVEDYQQTLNTLYADYDILIKEYDSLLDELIFSVEYVEKMLVLRGRISVINVRFAALQQFYLVNGTNLLSTSKVDHAIAKSNFLKEKDNGKPMSVAKAEVLAREKIITDKASAEDYLAQSSVLTYYIYNTKMVDGVINQIISTINKRF